MKRAQEQVTGDYNNKKYDRSNQTKVTIPTAFSLIVFMTKHF